MTRALVLTGGVGHDFEGTTAALRALLAADRISTEVHDDPARAFDALAADHWDLLVVNALRWRMLADRYASLREAWAITTPPAAEPALAAHLAAGGGVLVTHTGLVCFDDWPGWADALGAGWDWQDDRSCHPPLAEVAVRITGGDMMSLEDEVYGFLDWKAPVDVLATGHHTGCDHPVIWRREHGDGRVAVDLLGHHAPSYESPRHAAIVRGLARWAAGLDDTEQLGGRGVRSLEGMSAVVTGGGSGIGAATARYFCERGAVATINGRRGHKVAEIAASIHPRCLGVPGDVTNDADRRRLVEAAVEHGGGRLDVLVNNAGNMERGPITNLDEDRLKAVFDTNVIGPMLLTGLAVPHLAATGGCVVFIGSVHTRRAFPGASPYAATKGAVETLTGVLAAELGPSGIRVSCVRPGAVFTEINVRAGLGTPEEALARLEGMAPAHALGRIGTTEEIAEAIAYLATAEWTTGSVLTVDGGLGLGVTNA